ncbi:hypothetical protein ACOSQ2_017763 [Xanthoceras sorbifolium]
MSFVAATLDNCKCCGVANETILHVLWSCSALNVVRAHCPFVNQQHFFSSPSSSFLDFFVYCYSSLRPTDLCLLLVVLWKQLSLPAIDIVCWSISFLNEFVAANFLPRPQAVPCAAVRWSKPQVGWLKLNVDASLKFEASFVGLAAVIRDHEGLFLTGLSRKLIGLVSIEVAEASVILNGIHLAIEFGFNHLLVESNALNVINYINSRSPHLSEVGLVIADIFALCFRINVAFSFVPQCANYGTHLLAMKIFSVNDVSIWLQDAPP